MLGLCVLCGCESVATPGSPTGGEIWVAGLPGCGCCCLRSLMVMMLVVTQVRWAYASACVIEAHGQGFLRATGLCTLISTPEAQCQRAAHARSLLRCTAVPTDALQRGACENHGLARAATSSDRCGQAVICNLGPTQITDAMWGARVHARTDTCHLFILSALQAWETVGAVPGLPLDKSTDATEAGRTLRSAAPCPNHGKFSRHTGPARCAATPGLRLQHAEAGTDVRQGRLPRPSQPPCQPQLLQRNHHRHYRAKHPMITSESHAQVVLLPPRAHGDSTAVASFRKRSRRARFGWPEFFQSSAR